jgi:hypothetical protein
MAASLFRAPVELTNQTSEISRFMATLSFHAPAATARKIRAAARKRGEPLSGLGRELEKLAIDSMALVSLERIRDRAAASGADKMTPAQITNLIKETRRARRV